MQHFLVHSLVIGTALAFAGAACAGSIEPGDHLEMAAVLQAQVTPTEAVQIAERAGGSAYGYGMEANAHGHWYEVDVLRGHAKLLVKIDSRTGKVLGSSAARGDDVQGAHALAGSKLTLGAAMTAAERAGGGPALEADAAGRGPGAHVEVDVIQHHGQRIAHYRVTESAGHVRVVKTGTDA